MMRRPSESRPTTGQVRDIALTLEDRTALAGVLVRWFRDDRSTLPLLQQIGFPLERIPGWQGTNAATWWALLLDELDGGVIAQPYRRLLAAVLRTYQANGVLLDLAERYGVPVPDGTVSEPAPAAQTEPTALAEPGAHPAAAARAEPTCHVIVRASAEEDRDRAVATLTALGLGPMEVWSTEHAMSFALNSGNVREIRQRLNGSGLGWTLVSPGQPDYLLRELYVQGPDERVYRYVDAPAQQTVHNVASEIAQRYRRSSAEGTRPTVVDLVGADGVGQRLNPEDTLHDAGVRDGDHLRVAFEATAGHIHKENREEALDRVRSRILAYTEAHPGFTVQANSVDLPTAYEASFRTRSFGPPVVPGGPAVEIWDHRVWIELGPGFPQSPPNLYWLTPIFHPNVFPNYDCEEARREPQLQGLVCLGLLAEGWRAAIDFADVCQVIVDMAAFRNYDLFEPTGVVTGGELQLRGNFYDQAAARWALQSQAEIAMIGGRAVGHPPPEDRYPNVVEPWTADGSGN
jgi:hypothetical protein